jgi:hypothetical protein
MAKRKSIELPVEIVPVMKQIGMKIVQYRKQSHPNYRTYAEDKNINVMTFWRLQSGEDIKMSSFMQILKKMDVDPEDFFTGFKW